MHTLLFLHGWATDGAIWAGQHAYFEKRCRVLTPDMNEASLGDISANLDRLIRTERSLIVIGWSMGWLIALKLLENSGLNIQGLVSIAGTAKFISGDTVDDSVPAAELRALRIGLRKNFSGTLRRFCQTNISPGYAQNMSIGNNPALIRQLDIFEKEDLRDHLDLIKVPALFITGDKDKLSPVSSSRYMHDRVPGSSLNIIPGAGHAVFLEKPDEINKILYDFIEKICAQNK